MDIFDWTPGTKTIEINGCRVVYTVPSNRLEPVELHLVETPKRLRGQGRARYVIDTMTTEAAARHREIRLTVIPQDKDTSPDRLVDLYRSVGFKGYEHNDDGDLVMMRGATG